MGELLSPGRLLAHLLSAGLLLSREEQQAVADIAGAPRRFTRDAELAAEGSKKTNVWLLAEGFAYRVKFLNDGRRQIVSLMIPGELTERGLPAADGLSHAVVALTDLTAVSIVRDELVDLARAYPRIAEAFFAAEARRSAALAEHALSLGRRTALERMAYVFYETFVRLSSIGLVDENGFDFPMTQSDLGDYLGLSAVHINRTLQQLRSRALIEWQARRMHIVDPRSLAALAQFSPEIQNLATAAPGPAVSDAAVKRSEQSPNGLRPGLSASQDL